MPRESTLCAGPVLLQSELPLHSQSGGFFKGKSGEFAAQHPGEMEFVGALAMMGDTILSLAARKDRCAYSLEHESR
jgi:hypothetical protein